MTGVQSWWSNPHIGNHEEHSEDWMMLWALSVAEARRIFDKLILVTDKRGAKLFKDFPYDQIYGDLEKEFVPPTARHIWAAGKLHVYQLMKEEFCHFDGDVILHQTPHVFGADVFAQSDESFVSPVTDSFEENPVANILNGLYLNSGFQAVPWIPGFARHRMTRSLHKPYNVGIFGGRDLDFIHKYAKQALDVIRHPLNQQVWPKMDGVCASCFVEQYILGAKALHEKKHITVLFPHAATKNETYMQNIGFSHLYGDSKHDQGLMQRVRNHLLREHEYLYRVVEAMKLPRRTVLKNRCGYYY